ncbi:MAG: hypothetical protein P8Y25_15605 [Chromatiaceae bacterium]
MPPRGKAGLLKQSFHSLQRRWQLIAGAEYGAEAANLRPSLPPDDWPLLRQQMAKCLEARGGEVLARSRAAALGRAYLALDGTGRENFLRLMAGEFDLDVEGAEGSVLDGMRAGLEAGRYGALALELHPAHLSPDQIDSILADLRAAGFTLFAMEEDAAWRLEDDAGPVEELVALHAAVLPAFNLADGGSRLLLPDALAVQLGG